MCNRHTFNSIIRAMETQYKGIEAFDDCFNITSDCWMNEVLDELLDTLAWSFFSEDVVLDFENGVETSAEKIGEILGYWCFVTNFGHSKSKCKEFYIENKSQENEFISDCDCSNKLYELINRYLKNQETCKTIYFRGVGTIVDNTDDEE